MTTKTNYMNKMTNSKTIVLLGSAVATLLIIGTSIMIFSSDASVSYTRLGNPDAPFWRVNETSTGYSHLIAWEISPQDDYHSVRHGSIQWFDKVIDKNGNDVRVTNTELDQFKTLTGKGNTDFKILFDNGTERYYRLYYMEVP